MASAYFSLPRWSLHVRGNHVYGHISGPLHRLDISFHAKDNAASRSLPHGLVGQSFSSTASRWGNVDEYPAEGHFTTAAMAEGAIEGEAAMYEVAAADATSFAFSRFDAQEITGPVDLRLASAVDATSTDEAFTST